MHSRTQHGALVTVWGILKTLYFISFRVASSRSLVGDDGDQRTRGGSDISAKVGGCDGL